MKQLQKIEKLLQMKTVASVFLLSKPHRRNINTIEKIVNLLTSVETSGSEPLHILTWTEPDDSIPEMIAALLLGFFGRDEKNEIIDPISKFKFKSIWTGDELPFVEMMEKAVFNEGEVESSPFLQYMRNFIAEYKNDFLTTADVKNILANAGISSEGELDDIGKLIKDKEDNNLGPEDFIRFDVFTAVMFNLPSILSIGITGIKAWKEAKGIIKNNKLLRMSLRGLDEKDELEDLSDLQTIYTGLKVVNKHTRAIMKMALKGLYLLLKVDLEASDEDEPALPALSGFLT